MNRGEGPVGTGLKPDEEEESKEHQTKHDFDKDFFNGGGSSGGRKRDSIEEDKGVLEEDEEEKKRAFSGNKVPRVPHVHDILSHGQLYFGSEFPGIEVSRAEEGGPEERSSFNVILEEERKATPR